MREYVARAVKYCAISTRQNSCCGPKLRIANTDVGSGLKTTMYAALAWMKNVSPLALQHLPILGKLEALSSQLHTTADACRSTKLIQPRPFVPSALNHPSYAQSLNQD